MRIQIDVDDDRGSVFSAMLSLERQPLSLQSVRRKLLKTPVMTLYIVFRIYWQALQLYVKGVPYVPYTKETT